MTSRATSSATMTSLGLLLSTSMVLPSGDVNLGGVSAHAYCIRSWTDLSLKSLLCAEPGPTESSAIAAAHTRPAPTLAHPLSILVLPLIKPALAAFLFAFELAMPGICDVWHRSGQKAA